MINQKEVTQGGFTLVEVLMVVVIISIMAAIAIPKISSSSETARKNADIATAHQVKAALDRFQVENGIYPKRSATEFSVSAGTITAPSFIPKYISKLDATTTQQRTADSQKGFGLGTLDSTGLIPSSPGATNLIMIYLTDDGSGAEVRAHDANLSTVIWSSSN